MGSLMDCEKCGDEGDINVGGVMLCGACWARRNDCDPASTCDECGTEGVTHCKGGRKLCLFCICVEAGEPELAEEVGS